MIFSAVINGQQWQIEANNMTEAVAKAKAIERPLIPDSLPGDIAHFQLKEVAFEKTS